MEEEDPVTVWATTTGTSPLKVQITLDTPMQKFWLWQAATQYDLGSEDLDGRPRDQIWEALKLKNPLLKNFRDYRMFKGQEEVSWEDLPVCDTILVPREIPVVSRGVGFKCSDYRKTPRLRTVGPLTQMSYQIFTIEKTPVGEPIEIQAPNEISLAQLVTFFILPTGIQVDVGSVFYWNLEQIEDSTDRDKTKRKVVQIPTEIPPGFNLRVKCSSLREASTKKMANCRYGSAVSHFAMPQDVTLGRLKEMVSSLMNERGEGPDWTIKGEDGEAIDFEWEDEVIPLEVERPVKILLKRAELEVMPSLSWINLSDQLVKRWRLPKGPLRRI
jgi:hypothetical protein